MTDKACLTDIITKIAELGDITYRPMMGEYLLYLNGKYVGCICDNTLFVKSNSENVALVKELPQRSPYDGAKPAYIVPCDEADTLRRIVHATYLGAPEKKK